jgi:neurotrypsin
MGAFGYVACCFALFAFCTADLVPEGRNDVVTPFIDYAVRLVGGSDHTEGRFELAIGGVWGTVCDAGFSDIDAEVACVSLGFDQNQGNFLRNKYGPGNAAMHFRDVDCVGTELAIDDCPHSPLGEVGDCTHDNVVSISCEGDGGYPVRLVGGIEPHEGRLEIQYQGVWGTVCNDEFTDLDVQVACNSLGFGYIGYVVFTDFGETTGPIHLDEVDCTGDETNIGYCAHAPWGDNNCGHIEDIKISCSILVA